MLAHNKLNNLQLNMLKSFQYIDSKEKLQEIDSLINFYLEKKLDEAIEKEEAKRSYTAEIYNEWLLTKSEKNKTKL